MSVLGFFFLLLFFCGLVFQLLRVSSLFTVAPHAASWDVSVAATSWSSRWNWLNNSLFCFVLFFISLFALHHVTSSVCRPSFQSPPDLTWPSVLYEPRTSRHTCLTTFIANAQSSRPLRRPHLFIFSPSASPPSLSPAILPHVLLILSLCLPLFLPALTPCSQTLSLALSYTHTHTAHQQLPPRPSPAEDVYFIPLS